MKKIRSRVKKTLIICSLIFLWFLLTVWYIIIFDESVLVLSYNHSIENFIEKPEGRLLEGEKISGEFVAKDENLGIIILRFEKFRRIPYGLEDTLVFRIKEKNSSDWYYENEYRSGLTYDVPFLPFGFPIIPDSEGRTYYFELESLGGNPVNGLVLSDREPVLVSKYQKYKEILFSDFDRLINFSYKKFFYSFYTIDVAYSSFVFLLPLAFYLTWISPLKKKIIDPVFSRIGITIDRFGKAIFRSHYPLVRKRIKTFFHHWMMIILISTLTIDIFLLQVLNDLLYILVFFLWIFLLYFRKKTSSLSIIIGLVILIICPLALQLNNLEVAEEAGGWAFIFLLAGVIKSILEYKKKE